MYVIKSKRGGVDLNVFYGTTEPEEENGIWIKEDIEPEKVEILTYSDIQGANTLTSLPSIPSSSLVQPGTYSVTMQNTTSNAVVSGRKAYFMGDTYKSSSIAPNGISIAIYDLDTYTIDWVQVGFFDADSWQSHGGAVIKDNIVYVVNHNDYNENNDWTIAYYDIETGTSGYTNTDVRYEGDIPVWGGLFYNSTGDVMLIANDVSGDDLYLGTLDFTNKYAPTVTMQSTAIWSSAEFSMASCAVGDYLYYTDLTAVRRETISTGAYLQTAFTITTDSSLINIGEYLYAVGGLYIRRFNLNTSESEIVYTNSTTFGTYPTLIHDNDKLIIITSDFGGVYSYSIDGTPKDDGTLVIPNTILMGNKTKLISDDESSVSTFVSAPYYYENGEQRTLSAATNYDGNGWVDIT